MARASTALGSDAYRRRIRLNLIVRWLNMGGYGIYIWSCYGLAMVMLLGNLWHAHRQKKRVFRALSVQFKTMKLSSQNGHSSND